MGNQFEGKTIIVTGASSGIGRATAQAFAREGAKVMLADVQDRQGKEVSDSIRKEGGQAAYCSCDVSKPEQVANLIATTLASYGRLDVACNNAGIEGESNSTVDCDEANWNRTIDINLKGVWLCMKNEIPAMLKTGGGAIVNMSSIAGLVGFQGIPAYTASKHGVVGLTRTAALEYAKVGIRVNALCPGVIQTPMVDRFVQGNPETLKQLSAGEPVGRIGKPEEIASAVLWLSSSGASFVTGQAIAVDGGWIAQ